MKKITPISIATALAISPVFANAAPEVNVSGLIEVEASFGENFGTPDNTDHSDIKLATMELGFSSQVNDKVSAEVYILHEDDDTDPAIVDVATIRYSINDTVYLEAGRTYPFGVYETNMISDPLTLELGEMQEAIVKIGIENETGPYGSFYMFNGDTIETSTATKGDDTIEHFGFQLGYNANLGGTTLNVGIDYLNSIGDTDGLSGAITDANGDGVPDSLDSYVSGFALHAIVTAGNIMGIFEYVAADQFKAAELAFKGVGAEPSAMNLEVGYNTQVAGNASTLAFAIQTTDEAQVLGLAEQAIIFGLSMEIQTNTQLSFEFKQSEDYATTDGGSGNDASTITAQLAVSF